MTYEMAIKEAKRVGAGRAKGEALLAQTVSLLPFVCGAISPALVFEGAKKRRLSASQVVRMAHENPMDVANLMWETT